MNFVSTAYKRTAFVLLFSLFFAFTFYGVLIGFFLLSSGWGAPLTLTRGHEMVNKVEREITEVSIALNQTIQRIEDEALVKDNLGTVRKEIQFRDRQVKVLSQAIKKLRKAKAQLERASEAGQSADLKKLYGRRLINKQAYSSTALNIAEAAQRLAAIDIEIDTADAQITDLQVSRTMLMSLGDALEQGNSLLGISATSSDLLLLTKQSSDALAAKDIARSRLRSVGENTLTLTKSKRVLEDQIKVLQESALGRALDNRIDVVFVPYGSERNFTEGKKLYSCSFTIFWCSEAGAVGKPLPGEINSVHPFFGKPIRGTFVEMKLDNPDAAMREIIHGTRKPLFF
jgi:hypothetical protein